MLSWLFWENQSKVQMYNFLPLRDQNTDDLSTNAQCVHCTVFFPFDRARWDISSNLKTVILLNIYLSQRARSKGILRKVDFREPQTLNL